MLTATLEAPPRQAVTPELIMRYAWGFGPTMILDTAIEFKLFDRLEPGPKTAAQLSQLCETSARGMRALLDGLTGLSLVEKDATQAYALTETSRAFLVSSRPGFLGGLIRSMRHQIIPQWLDLKSVVASGKPAVAKNLARDGEEFFATFGADLFAAAYPGAQALARTLSRQFSGPVRVLDLAAGSGVWGIAMAQQSPLVSVTAVDWPKVIASTWRVVSQLGLPERFSYIEGDLQQVAFGSGYQVAILGHILHMQGEEWNRKLLCKAYAALAPGGTIAIAEFLANDDHSGPVDSMIFGVNMLLHTEEGDTYSFAQFRQWLSEAGFESASLLPVPAPHPLILARKPL